MDLTLPTDLLDMDAAIAALCQQTSKDALAAYARGVCGWRGDDARTAKSDIARAILEWKKQQPSDAPAPTMKPEAREMDARFAGKCAKCSGAIQRGERIYHVKATKAAYHSRCYDMAAHGESETRIADSADEQPAQPRAKPASDDAAAAVAKALQQLLAAMPAQMDADAVRAVVRDEVKHLQQPEPLRVIVREGQPDLKLDEHTHPAFDKALKIAAAGQPVLLKGPAGCGKSHLAAQIAKALKKEYGALHCSAGASEAQLLGWLLPTGEGGRFEYVAAQFARMFAQGNALFLIDEIDAADPNFLMVLNGALANGHLHVPQNWKQPSVERGEGFMVIAAANTYGTGADALYVGRNQLDAATLDRFYTVEMDYDRKLEARLAEAEVCAWAWKVRDRIAETKLRRVLSTRTIQRIGTAMNAGYSFDEARRDALLGWTKDELAKVGE